MLEGCKFVLNCVLGLNDYRKVVFQSVFRLMLEQYFYYYYYFKEENRLKSTE